MSRRIRAALAVAMSVLVATTATIVLAVDKPQVWIDQPLPGAVLPLEATTVTVHAADPAGIAKLIFLVDGKHAAEVAVPDGDLVVASWTWVPPAAGRHLITVLAVSKDGPTSDPVSVGVTVQDARRAGPSPTPAATAGPTGSPAATPTPSPARSATPTPGPTRTPPPTPSPTPTPTPTPTPSPTPSPTPCTPPLPDGLNPPDGAMISGAFNPPTFSWSYRSAPSCSPGGFRVTVRDADGALVTASGVLPAGATSWTPPAPLPVGRTCVPYTWTFDVLRSNGSVGQTVTRVLTACP